MTVLKYLKKNYVIAISGAVVVLCSVVFFIRDDQIRRRSADYDDLDIRRTRILKNMKYGVGLKDDLEEVKSMMKEAESRLFLPDDLAGNQRYFYQIERASGVTISNLQQIIKPIPTGKNSKQERKKAMKATFKPILYDMSVTGTYMDVLGFLREIEGGRAFATIDSFAMSGGKGEADSSVTMRLTVEVLGRKI
ncbi:hypothetical protein [Pelagicoccus sp. SDUM812003]|uniref:hypothetical protein n=1 Tax=Pelagicoccus sp. SDUM812003 TaxID=3041267 RepID=UPI00280FA310|nr:hypothetical protein [Pelagicoccus sp. SDUM812003]MDQ8201660.1 hypothetical protein [Pelagicoccus sp. SDUM812003]